MPWSAMPRIGSKSALALGVGAAVAVLALWWALSPRAVEVETAAAEHRMFEQVVEDDGRARVRERVMVTMPWTGELERPAFKEGHAVAAGEPLFWVRPLQPTLIDARTRAEWAARGAAAQASWQRASRQSEVALVAWQRSALAASRAASLAEQEFISRNQLEGAVLDLQREERAWQAARAAERAALHELEQTRVMLDEGLRTRPAAAGRHPVRATAPVQVLRVLQAHAAVLPAGAGVMEVASVENPEVVVPLLSADALRLEPGASARLSLWGGAEAPEGSPQGVPGVVRLIEPAAATKVSALGLEEQRVNVVVEPQTPLPAGDGYAVRVQVVLQRVENALQVPVSAVFPLPGEPLRQAVFMVRDGRARLQAVHLRARGHGWAWIGQGLEEGQAVVVYPPASLKDGVRVKVLTR